MLFENVWVFRKCEEQHSTNVEYEIDIFRYHMFTYEPITLKTEHFGVNFIIRLHLRFSLAYWLSHLQ